MTVIIRRIRDVAHAWLSLPLLLAMGCAGSKADAPLERSTHPLGLPAPGEILTIDFKNDALGTPLSRGDVLSEQFADLGIHFENGCVLGDLTTDFPKYQGTRPDNVVCAYSGGPQGSGVPCAGGVSAPNVPLVVKFDYPICFASIAGETLAFDGNTSPGTVNMSGLDASGQAKGAGSSRQIYDDVIPSDPFHVVAQGIGYAFIPMPIFGGLPNPVPSPNLDVRSLSISATHLGAFDNLVVIRCSNVIAQCSLRIVCQPPGQCTTPVPANIDNGSHAINGAPITLSQTPAGPYPLGITAVTLTASDGNDLGICTASVDVIDCTPPVITCPPPQTTECKSLASCAQPEGVQPATVTDDCSQITASGSFGCLQLGDNQVTYNAPSSSATEGSTFVSCNAILTVRDTLPPDISVASTAAVELWPPDGRMKTVTLQDCGISLNDLCAGPLNVSDYARITRVTADEGGGVDGPWRGRADRRRAPPSPDIAIVGTNAVELRAARRPQGDGRLYTIFFEAQDPTGNTKTGSCHVSVPTVQGGPTAVDSGVRQTAFPPRPSYKLTYLSDEEGDVNAI
ncbi:MAG TPA: hypothetical protein VGP07_21890, partial [Polyangia bacterium]